MSRHHCVLVVEDDADDVLFIRRALKKAGVQCKVDVVGDGEAALRYLQDNPAPTLMLLDIKLPRLSGLEVLERLRENPLRRRMIIVMLTGSQLAEDIDRAYAAGANSYLVKPISPAAMGELVQRLSLYWLVSNEPAPRAAP